nr:hypothetical protein [Flavobacterium sp. ASV13]
MKYLGIFISIFLFTSCYNDVKNIKIEGTIIDSISKKPIENAEVSIICWSYGKTPDGSYTGEDSIKVITDKKGRYESNFKKGAFIEVKSKKDNYKTGFVSEDITDNKVIIDFKLAPNY